MSAPVFVLLLFVGLVIAAAAGLYVAWWLDEGDRRSLPHIYGESRWRVRWHR